MKKLKLINFLLVIISVFGCLFILQAVVAQTIDLGDPNHPDKTNNYVNVRTRLGIGTSSPYSLLEIASSTSAEGLRIISSASWTPFVIRNSANNADLFRVDQNGNITAVGGFFGSNTANHWGLNGTKLYASSTSWNVGIGTTDPSVKLDVLGTGVFGNMTTSRGSYSQGLSLQNNNGATTSLFLWQSGVASAHFGFPASSNSLRIVNSSSNGLINNDAYILLTSTGRVGMGTTAPRSKLSIAAPGSVSTAALSLNGEGTYGSGYLASLGNYGNLSQSSSGMNNISWGAYHDGNAWVRSYTGGVSGLVNLQIGNGALFSIQTDLGSNPSAPSFTDVLTVKETKVGIGTTAPGQKLAVNGNIILEDGNTGVSNLPYVNLKDTTIGAYIQGVTYDTFLTNNARNADGTNWNRDNTSYGSMILRLRTATGSGKGSLDIFQQAAGSGTFTLPTASFTLDQSGNVGIGTSSPSAKLAITGGTEDNIKINQGQIGGLDLTPIRNDNAVSKWYVDNNFAPKFGGASLWATSTAGTYNVGLGNVGVGTTNPLQQLHLTKSLRLETTTASDVGVIYKGTNRFIHNFQASGKEGRNTFIGEYAGNFTMNGINSFNASNNIGIGYSSLNAMTTGYQNVALGVNTLKDNTTGTTNTAIGHASLEKNISGYSNTALGYAAAGDNTTGYNNTAFGYATLRRNTGGAMNTAIGRTALSNKVGGDYNTALGFHAGSSISGGTDNTSVSNSVYLGALTKASAVGNTNEIVIGYDAIGKGSNTATYGNTTITSHIFESGNVGIGTTSPASLLDVNGLIKMRSSNITQPEDVINKGYLTSALGGGEGFSSLAGFWKINSSNLYASSTSWKVGIGTTNPGGYKLNVNGPIFAKGITSIVSSGEGIYGYSDEEYGVHGDSEYGTGVYGYSPNGVGVTGEGENVGISGYSYAGSAIEAFSYLGFGIHSTAPKNYFSGNVGIGTTDPVQKLHISGTSVSGAGSQTNISAFNNNGLRISGSIGNSSQDAITYQSGSGGGGAAIAFGRGNSYDTFISFYTTQIGPMGSISEKMRINGNGVGIGTTNPGSIFSIVKSSAYNDENAGGMEIASGVANTNAKLILGAVGNSYSYIQSMRQDYDWTSRPLSLMPNGGNVGIGTTNPYTNFQVAGNIRLGSTNLNVDDNNNYDISTGGQLTISANDGNSSDGSFTNLSLNAGKSGGHGNIYFSTAGLARMMISTAGNVGIGTTNPGALLDVVNISGTSQIRLFHNTGGNSRPWQIKSGNEYATDSFSIKDEWNGGSIPELLIFPGDTYGNPGRISIGTTTSDFAYRLIVAGGVRASQFTYDSDIRLKDNIKTLDNALDKVLSLRGVSFDWKADGKSSVGLIAQEVEAVFPELVSGTDSKGVQYGNLVAPLIEAVKEQQRIIDNLEARINILEIKNKTK